MLANHGQGDVFRRAGALKSSGYGNAAASPTNIPRRSRSGCTRWQSGWCLEVPDRMPERTTSRAVCGVMFVAWKPEKLVHEVETISVMDVAGPVFDLGLRRRRRG
ncbi:hypothetical protein [Lysobacter gummosus]|uniref:hypothetical protein n=1 Tax=Lysobacter gummosus TaxID=262324 RepID=UPI003638A706